VSKKDKSQYMGVLGYAVARGIVRDARAGEAGPRGGWNALKQELLEIVGFYREGNVPLIINLSNIYRLVLKAGKW